MFVAKTCAENTERVTETRSDNDNLSVQDGREEAELELERKAMEEEKEIQEEEEEEQRWEELHAEIAMDEEKVHKECAKDEDDEATNDGQREVSPEFEHFKNTMWADGRHLYAACVADGTCTCPDRLIAGFVCKHLFRALLELKLLFTDLPKSMVDAPHLSIDHFCVKQHEYAMEGVTGCSDEMTGADMDTTAEEFAGHTKPASNMSPETPMVTSPVATGTTGTSGPPTSEDNHTSDGSSLREVFFSRMKQLSAMWHNDRLSIEMQRNICATLDNLYAEAREDEKDAINQGDDFTQRGTRRKRKINDTVDDTKSFDNNDKENNRCPHEFLRQNSKGRPKQKKQNISGGMLGEVTWEDVENAMDMAGLE